MNISTKEQDAKPDSERTTLEAAVKRQKERGEYVESKAVRCTSGQRYLARWRQRKGRERENADEPEMDFGPDRLNRVEGRKPSRGATATQHERIDGLLHTKDLSGLFDGMGADEAGREILQAIETGISFEQAASLIPRLEALPDLDGRSTSRTDERASIQTLDGLGGFVSYPKRLASCARRGGRGESGGAGEEGSRTRSGP